MSPLKKLFTLFSLSCLTVVVHTQASTTRGDLATLNNDCQATKIACSDGFDGTTGKLIICQRAFDKFDGDVKSATGRANNSPAASSSDSRDYITYINNTLEPCIKDMINAISSKRSQYINAGYKGIMCDSFNKLNTDILSFGNALISKASSDQKTAASSAINKIRADIQTGVAAFGC